MVRLYKVSFIDPMQIMLELFCIEDVENQLMIQELPAAEIITAQSRQNMLIQ